MITSPLAISRHMIDNAINPSGGVDGDNELYRAIADHELWAKPDGTVVAEHTQNVGTHNIWYRIWRPAGYLTIEVDRDMCLQVIDYSDYAHPRLLTCASLGGTITTLHRLVHAYELPNLPSPGPIHFPEWATT